MPERHQLTELQLAILRVLWDRGEATVQDIWEALHAERGLAQTTVATMLSRLERRGVVTRRAPPESRQYHYRAAVTEREVQHSMVGELTERLFDGDVTALVQHLLTAEDVSPGDIARIRDMIERVETTAPLASSMFAWLLTYLIHSSALLGLAWLVTRRRRLEPVAADLLWKVALVAGLVTGTIQSRLDLSTSRAVTLPAAASPLETWKDR